MNGYLRTAVLLAGLTALFVGVGYAMGGQTGMVIAFLFACGTNLWAWWNSDRVVLSMHNAEPIAPESAPRLFHMVEALAARAGLPMPALYVIHEDQPNAFATGRSPERAAVAVNTGLLDLMDEEEVAGVVAHAMDMTNTQIPTANRSGKTRLSYPGGLHPTRSPSQKRRQSRTICASLHQRTSNGIMIPRRGRLPSFSPSKTRTGRPSSSAAKTFSTLSSGRTT